MSKLADDPLLTERFEFWTADGYLWMHDGRPIPCEAALTWYSEEREAAELIDLGGES